MGEYQKGIDVFDESLISGIVTSDIENADSMSVLKWNNERNGLYHKHIPFNWGQKFPTSELAQYWNEQVSVDTVDGLDYGPYVAMLHDVCLILGSCCLYWVSIFRFSPINSVFFLPITHPLSSGFIAGGGGEGGLLTLIT